MRPKCPNGFDPIVWRDMCAKIESLLKDLDAAGVSLHTAYDSRHYFLEAK